MELGTDLRMLLTALGVVFVLIVLPFASIEYDRRKELRRRNNPE
jgi:hypothetical protein